MGGKNQTQTNTSSQSYTPAGLSGLQSVWNQLQSVASQPYTPYNGELTAPVNQQQQTGIGNINASANYAQPYIQQAAGYANQAAQPLTSAQIQQYQSPYTQSVVNATEAQFNNQNAQQQAQLSGNAVAQGALGGNRVGVAQANLAGQQQLAQAPTIANLYNQGYNTALQTAQQQQQNQANAAYSLGNLGVAGQNAALTGAGAQINAGTLQQQTQQAQDTASYNQYLQQLAFPYQQAQFLASLGVPTLGAMGGSQSGASQSTAPGPSPWGQAAGVGLTALSLFAKNGGRIKSYASGGITGTPYDADTIIGYVPKAGGVQIGPRPQFGNMQSPNMLQNNSNPMSGMPSAQTIKGASSGLGNLFSGFNSSQLSAPELLGSGEFVGPLGYSPMGEASGGRIKPDFVNTIHSIRHALKARHYDDGGAVIDMNADPSGVYSMSSPVSQGFNALNPYSVSNVPATLPQSAGFAPNQAPALPPPTSIAAMPVAAQPADMSARSAQPSYGDRYAQAIGGIESGGDYSSVGPETRTGDRAYGKYQVMGANIPEWTAAVIGKPMTPQQFLASPAAQDAVFKAKFGTYVDKYGPEGASKAWFAGENGMNDPNRRDILGTSVADYAGKFNHALGFADNQQPDNPLANPTIDMSARSATPGGIASSPGGSFLSGLFGGKGGGLSDQARQGLLAAGLGMMASRSPFALTQIGEGGLQGVQAYTNAQKMEQEKNLSQQRIDLQAKQLAQQAENFAKEFGLKQQQYNLSSMQPVKVGQDIMGRDIYAQRDPKTGQYINLQTGKPISESPQGSPFITPPAAGVSAVPPATTPGATAPVAPVAAPNGTPAPAGEDVSLPSGAKPAMSENPNVHPDFLATLNPQIASQVKALSEGRMQFPSGFALKSPYWQSMLQMVSMYDPSFDAVNYNARSKARNDFTSGKSAQNITSFNTAIGHLDTLDKSVDALGNTNFPSWNKLANAVSGQYDPKFQSSMKQFQAAKNAVVDELTRAFRGSGGNVHDIVEWENTINSADSPAALHSATKAAIELLRSRIESVGDQYNRGMGTTKDPLTLLSPKARQVVQRIDGGKQSETPTAPGAQAGQSSGFTGRTATGPGGQKLRETSDGRWVP